MAISSKDILMWLQQYISICTCRCLKELLDGGADVTKVDKDNNNILHIACIHGQLNTVQFLLQSGLISPELRYQVIICVLTI